MNFSRRVVVTGLGLITGVIFGVLLQKSQVLRFEKQVGFLCFKENKFTCSFSTHIKIRRGRGIVTTAKDGNIGIGGLLDAYCGFII